MPWADQSCFPSPSSSVPAEAQSRSQEFPVSLKHNERTSRVSSGVSLLHEGAEPSLWNLQPLIFLHSVSCLKWQKSWQGLLSREDLFCWCCGCYTAQNLWFFFCRYHFLCTSVVSSCLFSLKLVTLVSNLSQSYYATCLSYFPLPAVCTHLKEWFH